jgi:hypothetical protein
MQILRSLIIRVAVLALLLAPAVVQAQCAMCRASAEGTSIAKGLNTGILYLLAFPFLVIFGGGIFWYLNRKKFQAGDWNN